MSITSSRLTRFAAAGALTCALMAPSAGAATAAPASAIHTCRVQLGAGLPSVPCDPAVAARQERSPALEQERYYSSYGSPEPIQAPVTPAPPADTPWATIAIGVVLGLVGAGIVAIQRRRLRLRRGMARAAGTL